MGGRFGRPFPFPHGRFIFFYLFISVFFPFIQSFFSPYSIVVAALLFVIPTFFLCHSCVFSLSFLRFSFVIPAKAGI
jgi:hypothetical protein